MSSTRTQYTPTTRATVLNRLRELSRELPPVLSRGTFDGDPDDVIEAVEDLLDTLAERVSPDPIVCADCGDPLAEFRVRRWYPRPEQAPAVFECLCRSCEASREDAQAETVAHYATFAR